MLLQPVIENLHTVNEKIERGFTKDFNAIDERLVQVEDALYGKVGKDIRFDRLEDANEKLRVKEVTDFHKLSSDIEAMQLKASNEYFKFEQKL